MTRILILGGTEDGLALHSLLSAGTGIDPILSLAGRTASPKGLPPETRIGGFGGLAGLAAYLEANGISAVVDATHPFAGRISAHAAAATLATSTPRIALVRPAWQAGHDDKWTGVANETEAAAALPKGGRVFLALGAQKISAFSYRNDVEMLIRVIDPPEAPLLPFPHTVITGRGPFRAASETKIFKAHHVSLLVARNAGGKGAVAKLQAARSLGLPVIMISRPPAPDGLFVTSVEAARNWVMGLVGD